MSVSFIPTINIYDIRNMIIANYGHAKHENIILFQLYWAFEMSFLIGKHLKTELMRPIKMQQFSLIF